MLEIYCSLFYVTTKQFVLKSLSDAVFQLLETTDDLLISWVRLQSRVYRKDIMAHVVLFTANRITFIPSS